MADWELIDDDGELPPREFTAKLGEIERARMLLPGGRTLYLNVIEGATVRELLAQVPSDLHELLTVYNHGMHVADWDGLRLREGDRLLVAVTPQGGKGGGKQIVGAILMIAVAIFAPYAAGGIYAAAGGTLVAANAGLVISGITVGITMVAGMVISALVKPPSISTSDNAVGVAGAKSYSVTGQSNQPRAYSSCLVVYGQCKMMPAMAANPDLDNWANQSQLTALYDFGLGYVTLRDVRIGDVPVEEYGPSIVVHTNSYCDALQLNANRIGYDQYALALNRNDPVTVRTKKDTYCANLDINYPRGIFQQSPMWGALPFTADYISRWRKVGDTAWNEVPIDWYYGGDRAYTAASAGIQYALAGYNDWTAYSPSASPNDLRAKAAAYQSQQAQASGGTDAYALYNASRRNSYLEFRYPNGAIDEASYFSRYPEIKQVGWNKSALDHFESVGSREGRDAGVPVEYRTLYPVPQAQWNPYNVSTSPSSIHVYDKQLFGNIPDNHEVGGWWWIDTQASITRSLAAVPWQWRIVDSETWSPELYLRRYPDVANAGFDAWDHFIHYGAFEGRDPYVLQADQFSRSVRMTTGFVGSYWHRIFLVFPAPGEYEISVMRTDKICDGTDPSVSYTTNGAITAQFNESVVSLLRSYQAGPVVMVRKRHTMLEMRVRATDQLTGIVQNLSAIATSALPVTNDGVNFWWAETRNPAWIVIDLLCSEKNPRPLSYAQLDWPSWLRLAWYCDTLRSYVANGAPYTGPRFTCDIVVDSFVNVKDLAESILSGCRASLTLTQAGTWGVLIDEEKTTPRQLLTPANSWGFSGARSFAEYPHALRVNFINRDNGWNKDEVIVYWDGYSAANATIFETLDTYGVTDYPHAWAYGRYMMAQGIQRSEIFTLSMDVENMLVQRGDLVHVAHDVPRIGGMPARVVQAYVWDAPHTWVQIDADLALAPSGYAVRRQDGTTHTGYVLGTGGSFPGMGDKWIKLDNVSGINADDLIVLGEYTRVVQPYLVQRITPGPQLTAELTLCKYAPGVYTADQGALPPWDAGLTNDYLNGTDLRSINVVATQALSYVDREPRVLVQLTWQTQGFALDHHVVTVISPSGERLVLTDSVFPQSFAWHVDALRERKWFDVTLQFEVKPVNALGFVGLSGYATIVLARDTTPPHAVVAFGANVQKENVDLFWTPDPSDPDVGYYMIRYTPQAEYPDWNASQEVARLSWPGTKTSVGARTGSYGIRVADTSGNVGPVVWRRTTVAVLPDINVITVLNDRDLYPERWPGPKSHVVKSGAEIESEGDFGEVYPDGIYYCSAPIDLGDVYEVRVTSKIEAYGVIADDYMSNWLPSLAELPAMSRASSAMWDAWLEVRTSDDLTVIADWPTMSEVDPIADADDDDWSPWRPVMVGDFTAQLLQFRIILQSKNPGVRVVCNSGRIEVDMPDRIDSYGDVQVPQAGLDFYFTVPFRELQSLAITIDGNAQPVVAKVSNKTPLGFHLQLVNTVTAAAAPGQVDIMAEGYGRKRLTSI